MSLICSAVQKEMCRQAKIFFQNGNNTYLTKHFATTHVVVCKTSYYLLISSPPTNISNTLKIHTGENKIDRQSRMWRQYTYYFPANGSTNPDIFQPKTFPMPRGIIPHNFRSLGFAVSEELGNKLTNKQTHSLTSYCFYRVIQLSNCLYDV